MNEYEGSTLTMMIESLYATHWATMNEEYLSLYWISRPGISYGLFGPSITGTGDSDQCDDDHLIKISTYETTPTEGAYE